MSFRTHASILVLAVTLALQGCASAPPSPAGAKAPDAQLPATATDTRQQLDALFENYFEDNLRANPLLATYIGDHRYDDQLPNSIGPQYLAAAHAMNQKYLAAIRAHRPGRALAGGPHLVRHLPVRARARSARRTVSVPPAADQPGRQPAHRDARAGFGHQRAAVRDGRRTTSTGCSGWTGWPSGWTRRSSTCARAWPRASCSRAPVMEKVLVQLDAMVVPQAQDSQYFAPIKQFPASFSAADRERLTAEYTRMLDAQAAARLPATARFRARRIPAADAQQRRVDGVAGRAGVVRATTCRSTPPRT